MTDTTWQCTQCCLEFEDTEVGILCDDCGEPLCGPCADECGSGKDRTICPRCEDDAQTIKTMFEAKKHAASMPCIVDRINDESVRCVVSYTGLHVPVRFPSSAILAHKMAEGDHFYWTPVPGRDILPEDIEPGEKTALILKDNERLQRFLDRGE